MNMRIPLQVPAKSMNDRNQAIIDNIGIIEVILGMHRNILFSFSFFTDVMKNELENLIDSSRKF